MVQRLACYGSWCAFVLRNIHKLARDLLLAAERPLVLAANFLVNLPKVGEEELEPFAKEGHAQ